MPGGRTLPNLALQAFFDLGEDGWDDDMSLNLLKLSVVVQGVVDSIEAALPGSPTDGDIVILDEAHGTHPNEIAVRDDGAWVYIVPANGWMLFNTDDGQFYRLESDVWTAFTPSGGSVTVTEEETTTARTLADSDDDVYVFWTHASAKTLSIDANATTPLSAHHISHHRNNGAGDLTIDDSNVTINPPAGGTLVLSEGMTASLIRTGVDQFDLVGQTVAA